MVGTPRSAKRRRLNASSPNPPARSIRGFAKKINQDELDVYDDIDGALTPSTSFKTRKGARKQAPRDESPKSQAKTVDPITPSKRARITPQSKQKSAGKASARSSRRRAVEASDGEDEGPEEGGADELDISVAPSIGTDDADPLGAELRISQTSTPRKSRAARSKTEVVGKATNGTPQPRTTREVSKTGPVVGEDEEDSMDIDLVDAPVSRTTKGKSKVTNRINSSTITTTTKPSSSFSTLKSIALAKLTQRRPIPLTNLTTEYTKVHQLLEATVAAGESNSMLLIGARGSGKTALVNAALLDLSRSQKEHFHTVRLNGFIQTDDKLALREIWRQLGLEMSAENEDETEDAPKSYADTLTMLLALLSHPDEITDSRSDKGTAAKSVIFVMDEFDLFATHARQTLLYNLLDIAQSRKAPIAVLGLTTRIDVMEGLEKRVKSRFSHRFVHLGLARTLSEFVDVGKAAMKITGEELSFEEKGKGEGMGEWNDAVEALFSSPAFLKQHIQPIYYTTKSIPTLLSSILLPTSTLTSLPTPTHYLTHTQTQSLNPPDSNLHLLPSLSELSLSLLIAAARLSIIHNTDHTNFPLSYAEYISLSSRARLNSAAAGALATGAGARVFGKEVARKEWERLIRYGLLVPVQAGAFGLGSVSAKGAGEMVRCDVLLEEIPLCVESMGAVMEKWCRQI